MRDSQVVMNLSCQKIGYFRSVADSSNKGLNYYMSQIIEGEIESSHYATEESISAKISSLGGDIVFDEQVKDQTIIINRFKDYMASSGLEYITKISDVVNYQDREVNVTGYVFKNNRTNELIFAKLKNTKPTLTVRSRKGNRAEDNVELFMLNLLIRQYVKKLNIDHVAAYPALIFLRHKNDRGDFYSYFEDKEGDNIIYAYQFSDIAVERFLDGSKLVDIENAELIEKSTCYTCPFAVICDSGCKLDIEDLRVENTTKKGKVKKKKDLATDAQLEAINVNEGVVRVNAGAGTGKTFIIVNRILRLIDEGVDPSRLLLITFTNKGADEMRQRLKKSHLSEDVVDSIVIETFNSLGDVILKENYKEFGFKKEPVLIDKREKYKIVLELLSNNDTLQGFNYNHPFLSFRYAKGAVVRLAEFFDKLKDENIRTPSEFYEKGLDKTFLLASEKEAINSGYDLVGKIFFMYLQYNSIFKKDDYIDFKDQILKICEGIDNGNKVLEKMYFEHIIVDEYQDTDLDQLKIIQYFNSKEKCKSLMVVGDDSQAIFEFRGAKPDIMINFQKYFKNVKDVYIVENFRSTDKIINLANKINAMNTKRIDKNLYSNKKGSDPELFIGDLFELVDFKKLCEVNEKSDRSTAIIARTNGELVEIKKELSKMNIPSIIEAPLVENPNVLLLKQLLSFLISGDENIGIFNYLYLNDEEFKSLSIEDKKEYMKDYMDEVIRKVPIGYTAFDEDGNMLDSSPIKLSFLDDLVSNMGDVEVGLFYEELKEEYETIDEIYSLLHDMFLFDDRRSIQSFINYKGITLSTAHSSKGREFDDVYIINDKFKPSSTHQDSINEEVRLFFVAVTRAKENLTFISSTGNDYFTEKLS